MVQYVREKRRSWRPFSRPEVRKQTESLLLRVMKRDIVGIMRKSGCGEAEIC